MSCSDCVLWLLIFVTADSAITSTVNDSTVGRINGSKAKVEAAIGTSPRTSFSLQLLSDVCLSSALLGCTWELFEHFWDQRGSSAATPAHCWITLVA